MTQRLDCDVGVVAVAVVPVAAAAAAVVVVAAVHAAVVVFGPGVDAGRIGSNAGKVERKGTRRRPDTQQLVMIPGKMLREAVSHG